MKTSQRFDRAMSALVGAYLNDTLEPNTPCACAVGNIVAAGYGAKVYKDTKHFGHLTCSAPNSRWSNLFLMGKPVAPALFLTQEEVEAEAKEANENIAVTGYSMQDLMRIEYAFMFPGYGLTGIKDNDLFCRLCAVVDVLCDIEGIADASEYKALFAKSLPV